MQNRQNKGVTRRIVQDKELAAPLEDDWRKFPENHCATRWQNDLQTACVLQNSIEIAKSVRARIESRRKSNRIMPGLYRLREKACFQAILLRNFPQGLKATLILLYLRQSGLKP
jgi:hypothetical protein